MLEYDTPIYVGCVGGPIAASYGPRCVIGNCVESTHPVEAAFWGVYAHDAEGLAEHVGDAMDRESAAQFAQYVARSRI